MNFSVLVTKIEFLIIIILYGSKSFHDRLFYLNGILVREQYLYRANNN